MNRFKSFNTLFVFVVITTSSVLVPVENVRAGRITSSGRIDSVALPMSQLVLNYYEDKKDLSLVYIFTRSTEYFHRFTTFCNDWLAQLKSLPYASLDANERVDYLLLKRNIQADLNELEESEKTFEQYGYAIPFADKIIALQQQRRRGNKLDGMATAHMCHQVDSSIALAKKQISKQPLQNKEVQREAVVAVRELRQGLKNVYDFYHGYDPSLDWWLTTVYPNTDSALQNYGEWLAAQPVVQVEKAMDSSGIIGQPIGKQHIEKLLKKEYIPYSAEELIRIANEQFAWCDKEMKEASRAMGFGDNWKRALEKVKQNYVPPGYQPQRVNGLQEKAMAFIDSLGLITIPPLAKEAWRMDMLTTQQQKFASYFLGGSKILIAYPTDEMTYEEKMMSLRSNNYAFSNAVVYHELIPGHNLQYFMGRRYKPYRKVFSTPFSTEGWAFYWEMLLWDKGYDSSPEEKVGALFWRMTRCARVIFSLNYHLGNWTPQQCIDYLADRVGLERASAESEVRRSFTGGYGPLYQLAYMFGALQMYSLHKEIVGGGKMSDRDFHDAYLRESTIPIELFRAILLDEKLPGNFSTRWRF